MEEMFGPPLDAPPPPPDLADTAEGVVPPPDLSDAEGAMLWAVLEVANEALMESDPNLQVTEGGVKDIQADVLEKVFGVMEKQGRTELVEEDRAYIHRRVSALVAKALATGRRFAKLDRIVCNVGGARGWVPGTVQALNEDDPSDPTGLRPLPYVVKIDPPDGRLINEVNSLVVHSFIQVKIDPPEGRLISVPTDEVCACAAPRR